jgi:hypothetical protein
LSNAGLASGVINSIQIDPFNPMTVYALTANGCFKSTDGGADWTSASSGLGVVYPSTYGSPASQLAVDPLHPGTLYVGGYAGVYKTTNGAANWTLTGTGLPSSPWVQTVAVDPNVPTTLYAGTYFSGIYKSTNGASTWNIATNGLNTLNCDALVVDPNNSSNVYAGGGSYTFSASVFKSTNGGGNWTLLGGGLQGGAVNLLTASSSNLYAVVGNSLSFPAGSTPAFQISTNGGTNWSSLLVAGGLSFTALAIAPPTTPALTIASSGNNDNVSWPASFTGYVLQSTASLNPANWKNVMLSPVTNNNSLVVTVPASGLQGFYRLLLTNNTSALPATLYLGTDQVSGQGVLKSTDGGITWYIEGPAGDTINALAVNPAYPSTVYAGLNGGRDGFVATLTRNGQLEFSTYMGGSGLDQGNAIAAAFTDVYVAGTTGSSDFPSTTVTAAFQKPKLELNAVKPAFTTNKPVIISDLVSSGNFGESFVQAMRGAWGCPQNGAYSLLYKVYQGFNPFFGNYLDTLTGTTITPPNTGLQVKDSPDGYYLTGPDGTSYSLPMGTFTIKFSFTRITDGITCNWTDTYTITIQ